MPIELLTPAITRRTHFRSNPRSLYDFFPEPIYKRCKMTSTMERAYATTPVCSEDSRVECTLDHLSDDWGHLPADVKSHILTFVRHPVAALVQGRTIIRDFTENYLECRNAYDRKDHNLLSELVRRRFKISSEGMTKREQVIIVKQSQQINAFMEALDRTLYGTIFYFGGRPH